ncbi:MerR family transcriptional regulator (plasmid) [Alicyclobacillus fastidiosus]|uniref:MerR family transcriptional regulator n=1 Tax=Alicyclobacillus fastidiosus TaxID=392011 RepID=A0ABY6ZQ29_9BACL|nr:MerR family transcriptional regulator [Alicyclobacillus fastidiosus]WAH44989.1 MerR family transcriptional regulator [Alicyclobacillus fastidiosus]
MDFYQISDFAKEVGKHVNTVDGWFKALEEKRIHYVNRVAGAKVYDDLDLQIAQFIRDKRDSKLTKPTWSLEGIFDVLGEHFELRPFPQDEATTSVPQIADMEAIMREIRTVAQQIAAAQVEEVRQQYAELVRQLPKPVDPAEEKQKRLDDIITQRRVVTQLEDEALNLWSTKPKEERMKSAGFFRKTEDTDKRDAFVRRYVNEHLEERLKRQYGLTEE